MKMRKYGFKMLDNDEEFNRRKSFFDDWYNRHFDDKIKKNRMCDGDWKKINVNKDKKSYTETDMERDVYWNTFYTLANIRDNIVCGDPIPANELEDAARSLFNDLITLWGTVNDKNKHPCKDHKITDTTKKHLETIENIERLKDVHPLSYDDIEQIYKEYRIIKNNNDIYSTIENGAISTFTPPVSQDQKYDSIKEEVTV